MEKIISISYEDYLELERKAAIIDKISSTVEFIKYQDAYSANDCVEIGNSKEVLEVIKNFLLIDKGKVLYGERKKV